MRFSYLFLFLFVYSSVQAQFDHETIFPDLSGEELFDALVDEYKTTTVLTYAEARDTFMRNIDAVDNQLTCVYTGYTISLNPQLDPTTDAFSKGINTEHTFPRSKGASEGTNAYSDMHHLFPTRERVNTDRGALPLLNVNDNQADKWYFEDEIITNVPSTDIDSYSELLQNSSFEPREDHKGDVARAYFYFYTMYKLQADIADPSFFSVQQETMCDWHFQDPVDEKEWNRNIKISEYQDGKKNPFILDCKLARLYCDEIEGTCLTVSTKSLAHKRYDVFPNPSSERIRLVSESSVNSYKIYDSKGTVVLIGTLNSLLEEHTINISILQNGLYSMILANRQGETIGTSRFIKH